MSIHRVNALQNAATARELVLPLVEAHAASDKIVAAAAAAQALATAAVAMAVIDLANVIERKLTT